MKGVTRIMQAVEDGETEAAEDFLPMAYDELRRMAVGRMANERPDHTLQATALVHEAFLRLTDAEGVEPQWQSRAHFFGAAAEAMRRVLIDSARRKQSEKRGGAGRVHTQFEDSKVDAPSRPERVLAVDEALGRLEVENPDLAMVVKLRYFAGMTVPETASALEVSPSKVDRQWRSARDWLYRELSDSV